MEEMRKSMYDLLVLIKKEIYDKCGQEITGFTREEESKDYEACRFNLDGLEVVSRKAKITPKKLGQFVTFWKRNHAGIIEPLNESDRFDFYVITVSAEARLGQFVFPKSILIDKGIISTSKKEGKRGFRVYPVWDKVASPQAVKTQSWQLNYFYEIDKNIDLGKVIDLYRKN